ncbi:uncharacterized protein [Asterias amurensis]|uniref:uncharacterized protein n=1 Tax=Asterias amurensis TaxID=7602 RepID=UPI003AB3E9D1
MFNNKLLYMRKMESNQGNQTSSYHNLPELRHSITGDRNDNEEASQLKNEYADYLDEVECNITRLIPSLSNMCLKIVDTPRGRSDRILGKIPGLCHLVASFRHQRWLRDVRFNWLVKALIEAERSVSYHIKTTFDPLGNRLQLFRRDTRHVEGEMGTRYDPSLLHLPGMLPLPETVDGCDASDWCIAVLAHLINMLLPTTVSDSGLRSSDGQEVMKLYVRRVNACLVQWAPVLVKHCFDIAMVYVWWCRGYISKAVGATLCITALIPNEDLDLDLGKFEPSFGSLQKGIYFNELGRLMAQADQPEIACRFYCNAVECITDDSFDLHSRILCASAADQGQMDQRHAERAIADWDAVLREPHVPSKIGHAALVSMLHCHTGACVNLPEQPRADDKNKEWLLQMELRISSLALKNRNCYFHLSLIRALLGVEEGAILAYDTFSRYYQRNEVPGTIACFEQNKNTVNPWRIFSKWLTDRIVETGDKSQAIGCMPLLWRRVLCYPEWLQDQKSSSRLFDVCGATPKLKITTDGFLTGTFVGNLPPITSLLLDPYTGAVCFPDQDRPIEVQEWDNLYQKDEGHQPALPAVDPELPFVLNSQGRPNNSHSCGFRADTFIPTPVHLFTNKTTGATCSLLVSNEIVNYIISGYHQDDYNFYQRTPGIVHHNALLLYRQGSIYLKVDLRSVILQAGRDAILKCLEDNNRFRNRPQTEREVRLILDVCVDRGHQIGPGLLRDFINTKQGRLSRLYSHPLEDWNEELIHRCLPPPQVVRVSNIVFVGESTVILSCLRALEPYKSQRDNVLVFVNCIDDKTFQAPVVHFAGLFDVSASGNLDDSQVTFWEIPKQTDSWKSPGSKVFFAYAETLSASSTETKNVLVVFDAHGVVLMRQRDTTGVFHGCMSFTTTSGWHILGCDTLKTNLVSLNVRKKTCERYCCPKIESFQVTGGVAFVANPSGVVVLDAGSLTPLSVIRALGPIKDREMGRRSHDGLLVEREFRFLRVLALTTQREGSSAEFCSESKSNSSTTCSLRIFLGLANRVLILKTTPQSVKTSPSCSPLSVEIMADVALPGIPTEVCYVNQSVGFVVTATVSTERHDMETEILYWFDVSGGLRGVHPLLGSSPHGMLAVKLNNISGDAVRCNNETSSWHLYLDDGYGGICCIQLLKP